MGLQYHRCLLFIRSCFLVFFTKSVLSYQTYYVEQHCRSGKLNISLTEGSSNSAIFLWATNRAFYSIAMDCQIKVTAPYSNRIMVSILQTGFRTYPSGDCKDYIKINGIIICEDITRKVEERHYLSTDNTTQMLYHTSKDGLNNSTFSGYSGMKLTVTALKKMNKLPQDDNWFHCDNGYCIWSGLKCDTHNNCGDLSDEQDCDGSLGNKSLVLIILGVLILLSMVIMCIATLLCSKNESVRRFSNRLRSRTLSYLPKFTR